MDLMERLKRPNIVTMLSHRSLGISARDNRDTLPCNYMVAKVMPHVRWLASRVPHPCGSWTPWLTWIGTHGAPEPQYTRSCDHVDVDQPDLEISALHRRSANVLYLADSPSKSKSIVVDYVNFSVLLSQRLHS